MTSFQKPEQSGQAAALPKTYAQHPLSAAFPAMTTEEFQELKDSIENIGVQNPITLLDGMVIDGWHRYSACIALGMDCPVVELAQGTDPRDFVMAQNQARRHVTKAQLAMATTAVYAWKPPHREKAHIECDLPAKTNAELASIAGVHANTITQAKTVTAQAAPVVVDAVKRGELGLPKAVAIAKLPPEQQAQAISKPLPRPVVVVPPPKTSQPEDFSVPHGEGPPEGMNEDDFGPSPEEIAAAEAADRAERELVAKIIAADDVVAELAAEVKRLLALNEALNRRIDSLLNE
ncbi:ParB/RepB/Spo0J family partition protein, partial [Simplicispira metamorpha]